ncbi:hypothetical protein GCM10020221_10870 [Streptomyces thioluteus]|uniref:Uncharacterized protein n=1 Tax=Streptomyces thioluteus TaxID=66431 RepID=A0ABN3WJF5_STRTU
MKFAVPRTGAVPARRRFVALAAAALLAVPLAGTATAAAGTDGGSVTALRPSRAAVGTWSVRATGDDGNVIDTVMTLHADGTVSNNVGGTGTWTAADRDSFAFRLTEHVVDEHGLPVMRIEIEQKAVLSANGRAFTGSGTALTFDRQGTMTGETAVRTEARRA